MHGELTITSGLWRIRAEQPRRGASADTNLENDRSRNDRSPKYAYVSTGTTSPEVVGNMANKNRPDKWNRIMAGFVQTIGEVSLIPTA